MTGQNSTIGNAASNIRIDLPRLPGSATFNASGPESRPEANAQRLGTDDREAFRIERNLMWMKFSARTWIPRARSVRWVSF
jgi:hypothetical protein